MDHERHALERVVFGYRSRVWIFERIHDLGGSMRQPALELAVDAIGGVLALTVRGDLVEGSQEPLRQVLDDAVRGGRPVVLDLTEAATIDDAGIATLTKAHRGLPMRAMNAESQWLPRS